MDALALAKAILLPNLDPEATMPEQLFDAADDQELRMHNAMQERYLESVKAIKRFRELGGRLEEIITLCRETGVDIKDITCS